MGGIAKGFALDDGPTAYEKAIIKGGGLGDATRWCAPWPSLSWAGRPCYLFLNGPLMRIRSVRVLPFSVIRDSVYTEPSLPTAIEFT
jgi:hypothetical protein